MLKDGKLYGSIIPHDVHSLRLKGLTLGEKVDLQILALTDHAVGRDKDNGLENDGEGDNSYVSLPLLTCIRAIDFPVTCQFSYSFVLHRVTFCNIVIIIITAILYRGCP